MAETIRIAELANLITKEIGDFLKWTIHPENDLNFPCLMKTKHFDGAEETDNKTHPTDLVIYYEDPYENKRVYLNTDLKSYETKSIGPASVKEWLTSITKGTVCSLASDEWRQRYGIEGSYEIRGLLFIYNHDGKFDKPFFSYIYDYPNPPHTGKRAPQRFHLKDLNVPANLKLHVMDPLLIDNILSIRHDLNILRSEQKVPLSDAFAPISFFYPTRQRFKSRFTPPECPATIELISGPFFIMTYDNYTDFVPNPSEPSTPTPTPIPRSRGNIIYYKEMGSTVDEFIYLIETLMMYELIAENCITRIRHCTREKAITAKQNFISAIEKYCVMWDYSDSMKSIFNKIEFDEVTIIQKVFCNQKIDRSPVKD